MVSGSNGVSVGRIAREQPARLLVDIAPVQAQAVRPAPPRARRAARPGRRSARGVSASRARDPQCSPSSSMRALRSDGVGRGDSHAMPSSVSKLMLRLPVFAELTSKNRSSTASTFAWMNTGTSPPDRSAALVVDAELVAVRGGGPVEPLEDLLLVHADRDPLLEAGALLGSTITISSGRADVRCACAARSPAQLVAREVLVLDVDEALRAGDRARWSCQSSRISADRRLVDLRPRACERRCAARRSRGSAGSSISVARRSGEPAAARRSRSSSARRTICAGRRPRRR